LGFRVRAFEILDRLCFADDVHGSRHIHSEHVWYEPAKSWRLLTSRSTWRIEKGREASVGREALANIPIRAMDKVMMGLRLRHALVPVNIDAEQLVE
jgi:hypothetical protein